MKRTLVTFADSNTISILNTRLLYLLRQQLYPLVAFLAVALPPLETMADFIPSPPPCNVRRGTWYCRTYDAGADAPSGHLGAYFADDKIRVKVNDVEVFNENIDCSKGKAWNHLADLNMDVSSFLKAGKNEVCVMAECPCGCAQANGCVEFSFGNPSDECPLFAD